MGLGWRLPSCSDSSTLVDSGSARRISAGPDHRRHRIEARTPNPRPSSLLVLGLNRTCQAKPPAHHRNRTRPPPTTTTPTPAASPNMWMCPLVMGLKLPHESRITCVLLLSVMVPVRFRVPVLAGPSSPGGEQKDAAAGGWREGGVVKETGTRRKGAGLVRCHLRAPLPPPPAPDSIMRYN